MASSDAEAIQAVLSGDIDQYAELVDKYQGRAIRLAFSFLGNYEDAKDVSQEAFVSAYRSLGSFRSASTFSTWLYRIIVNACKDAHRRRTRQPVVVAGVGEPEPGGHPGHSLFVDAVDPGADPGGQMANQELARRLSEAIEALPMKQRTAFLLHHVHGLPVAETAQVMDCRPGTVKSHIFRATEQLRTALAAWLDKENA